jgi:hypothetical protein
MAPRRFFELKSVSFPFRTLWAPHILIPRTAVKKMSAMDSLATLEKEFATLRDK